MIDRIWRNFWGALAGAALSIGCGAHAQDAAGDPAGTWHGTVDAPQGPIVLVIVVSRDDDGSLQATLEAPDQAPGRQFPATEIAQEGDTLRWRVAPIGASWEGQWDPAAGVWQGTFSQGLELELDLAPGLPDAAPVVEGLDGTWRGTMQMNEAELRLVVTIETGPRGTTARLDSPDQAARGLPLSGLTRVGDTVGFAYAPGRQSFTGTLSESGDELVGAWSAADGGPFPLTFVRDAADEDAQTAPVRPQMPKAPFPYTAEEVVFDNPQADGVRLGGTLTLPEGEGPFPAAVLLSGSGPQDRDETLMGHKPFAVLADHLTRAGLAVLRFDDRGVGASSGDFAAATSADFATDANAAARFLASRSDIRHDAIGFVGHSEGGMVGPIAMTDNPDIAFLVMLAGPGTRLDRLLLTQRRLIGLRTGMSRAALDRSEPVLAELYAALGSGADGETALAAARALLTPDAMEAIGYARDASPDTLLAEYGTPWFRYFFAYDPAPNLAQITVPLLALGGSLDLQVPAAENLAAIAAATAGNSDTTIVELPGLNHLFQTATTGSVGEYEEIEETFAPAALDVVSDWLRARFVER